MTQRKGVLERNLNLTAADVNNRRRTRSEVDHLTVTPLRSVTLLGLPMRRISVPPNLPSNMPSSADYDYRPYLVSETVYPTLRDACEAMRTITKEYPHTRLHMRADEQYAKRPPESKVEREAAGNPPFRAYLHAVVSAEGTEAHFRKLAQDGAMCGPVEGRERHSPRYLEAAEFAKGLPDSVEERFELVAKEKDEGGLKAWPDGPWVERPEDPDASLPAKAYSTQTPDGTSRASQ